MSLAKASEVGGLDQVLFAVRKGWFGVMYILSRETKSTTVGFMIALLSDLAQFATFPISVSAPLSRARSCRPSPRCLSSWSRHFGRTKSA